METIKELHDALLESIPDGETHDQEHCSICNGNEQATIYSNNTNNTTRGGDKMTYDEEDFIAAVREAVAPVKATADERIDTLTRENDSLKAQLEEVHSTQAEQETAGQIAEMQSKLDEAELRASAAEENLSNMVAYLESVTAEKEAVEALEARKSEVRELIRDAAGFRDEYIEENLDRWASMSEELFEATLNDYRAARTPATEATSDTPTGALAETAISTVREEKVDKPSNAATVFGARSMGIDVRKFPI